METKPATFSPLEKTTRERGLRVVAIGGGTGLSTLLKGLKRFALTPAELPAARPGAPVIRDLCAVVTRKRRRRLQRTPSQRIQHASARRHSQLHRRPFARTKLYSRASFSIAFKRATASKATASAIFSSPRSPPSPETSPKRSACLPKFFSRAAAFFPRPLPPSNLKPSSRTARACVARPESRPAKAKFASSF